MKSPIKFGLPQGTLDFLILRVVALGPIHGYAIAQRIQQGWLYPALRGLEYKKFPAADWRPSETGREAKSYRLTAKVRFQLENEPASWARLTEVAELIP
jgi:DNA-binding PadR family transcriptional regulator